MTEDYQVEIEEQIEDLRAEIRDWKDEIIEVLESLETAVYELLEKK